MTLQIKANIFSALFSDFNPASIMDESVHGMYTQDSIFGSDYETVHNVSTWTDTVMVIGATGIDLDDVSMFFENMRRSGGGDVANIITNAEGDVILTFEEPAVAARVVNRSPFNYKNRELHAVPCKRREDSRAIRVTGIKSSTSKDALELFFESFKRCKGGDIANISMETDSAIITYENDQVAMRVLEFSRSASLILYDSEVKVEPYTSQWEPVFLSDPMAVHLEGISHDTSQDTLELFFESKKRCGGGDIDRMEHDRDKGTATIWYSKPSDAQNVLQKQPFSLDGSSITTKAVNKIPDCKTIKTECAGEKLTQSLGVKHHGSLPLHTAVNDQTETKNAANKSVFDTVELYKIPSHVTKEHLIMFLENKTRSGGGELADLEYFHEDEFVRVQYKNVDDAVEVCKKADLILEGVCLKVVPLNTCLRQDDAYRGSLAIDVSQIPEGASVTDKFMEMFFESKKNGGGVVDDLHHVPESGTAVVTFQQADDAERVLERHSSAPLTIGYNTLILKRMRPAPPPPLCHGPCEPDRWILTRLPEGVTTHDICQFFKTIPGTVREVTYSVKPGVALVVLTGCSDYPDLLRLVASRPLRGTMISVQEVPLPTAIQVYGWGKLSQEMVRLYFESTTRSGGGTLLDVTMHEENECMMMNFETNDILKRVLQKDHTLDNHSLYLDVFYPEMGMMPPEHDSTAPGLDIPRPICLTMTEEIGTFILQNEDDRKDLDMFANGNFAQIDWAASEAERFVVRCTIQQGTGNVKCATTWKENTPHALNEFINKTYSTRHITMLQEIFPDVSKQVEDIFNQGTLIVECDTKCKCVILTGRFQAVHTAEEVINGIIAEVEETMKREQTSIKEDIHLKPHQCQILERSDFVSAIHTEFSNVKISVGPLMGIVSIYGLPEEIKNVKLIMYEKYIHNIVERVEQLDQKCATLLKHKPATDYMHNLFQDLGIKAVWDATSQSITVYGLSIDEVETAVHIIHATITKTEITLNGPNVGAMQIPD